MDAIELRPNFSAGTSLFSSQDLYADKRAKLGKGKFGAINGIYDKFLATLSTPKEDTGDVYRDIQEKHGLTVYSHDITKALAEGAKKLRVGEIVETASIKFDGAVAVKRPVEAVVAKEEKPEVKPAVVEESPMSRTRLHEDTMPIYSEQPSTTDEISSRRLDSYLSKEMTPVSNEGTSIDKLAAKLSEISAIKEKTSSLQTEQSELLAEEEEIDRKLNKAFADADNDLLSATQSLDKIIQSINDTKGRLDEKRRMLERLNNVTK